MSLLKVQKIINLPIIFLTIWGLLFGFLCVGMLHKTSMEMSIVITNSASVAIAGEESCCGTTMSQHIQSWRSTFLVVPQGLRDALMLLALGLTLFFAYNWISSRGRHLLLDPNIDGLRLYIRENLDLLLFNQLKLDFARGILNPKIY